MDRHVILVIDTDADRADYLKSLIEFLDAPAVRIAGVDDWQTQVGDDHLDAIFIGAGIDDPAMQRILTDIGEFAPDLAVVRVGDQSIAA